MTATFQKATKAPSHLRLALCGGPGAGKTWTSLALASGLGHKVALLDTEQGSARHFAGDFDFDVRELDRLHPQHYIEGIIAAYQEGYDVLIIDSLSHAWQRVTPWHRKLVDTMLRLPLHLIVTLRSQVAYVVEKNARGQHVPRQVPLAPVQREGFTYELDVVGVLHDTVLRITKTRLRFLHGLVLDPDPQDPIAPGRGLGRCIAAELQGTPAVPAVPATPSSPAPQVTPQALKALWARITQHQVSHDAFRHYLAERGVHSTRALTPRQLDACLREIDTWGGRAFEPHDAPGAERDAPTQQIRAQLFEALTALQAEIAQAEPTGESGTAQAQVLSDLMQWTPRVIRACEHPETPASQLANYLREVNEARDDLRQILTSSAAA